MEDNVMERKFGELTLDELKKVCEICGSDDRTCKDGCLLSGDKCRVKKHRSVLLLITSYRATRDALDFWYKEAQELEAKDKENKEKITTLNLEKIVLEDKADKATKYDSVRNELIRTQELLKNAQDECRKRADKIKSLRETIDAMDDDYNELSAKLEKAEAARKSLEDEVESLNVTLDFRQHVIDQLTKEDRETSEDLSNYHVLMGSLKTIGKAIFNDQSGDHEKD